MTGKEAQTHPSSRLFLRDNPFTVVENWQYDPAGEFAAQSCCNCDMADQAAKLIYIGPIENPAGRKSWGRQACIK
jgi:hypothetical protein